MTLAELRRLALSKGLIVIAWKGYVATMEPLTGATNNREWRGTGCWSASCSTAIELEEKTVPALTIDECAAYLRGLKDIDADHLALVKEDIEVNKNWRWRP